MNDELVLEAHGLRHEVGPRTLWEDVGLRLTPTSAVAVRGPSGAGKSTLLRCLGGLDEPTHGEVRICGIDLHHSSERVRRSLRRDLIGFVVQDRAVVPEWSVEQNLRVVRPRGVPRAVREERIEEALLMVGLGGRRRQRAGVMSGGEQQRIAVARLLVQRPRLVIADEPTASLDATSAGRVWSALDLLRTSGSAIVVATHDPAMVDWVEESLVLGEPDPPANAGSIRIRPLGHGRHTHVASPRG